MSQKPEKELQDRLVTLTDGRPGLRGGIHTDIRDASGESGKPIIEFVASDETLDRYDEIIAASGWKLDSYRRNPVFQNAHKYGDVIFTLGRALVTEVREGRLIQQVEFAVDVNPMAKIAYGLYRGKFLNAVSVGFIPLKWENGTPPSGGSPGPSGPSTINSPTLTQQFRRRYTSQELLEVSAVGIPANPNALALGLKSGVIEKSDLQDMADLIRQTLDTSRSVWTAPADPASAAGGDGAFPPQVNQPSTINHQQLFALARDLYAIMRRT